MQRTLLMVFLSLTLYGCLEPLDRTPLERLSCTSSAECPEGLACERGFCLVPRDLPSDTLLDVPDMLDMRPLDIIPSHGNHCGPTARQCRPEEDEKCCNAQCVDLSTSVDHCGDCNQPCNDGELCLGGACACPPPLTTCDEPGPGEQACADDLFSEEHCGSCGRLCPPDTRCERGGCVCGTSVSIEPGQICCFDDESNTVAILEGPAVLTTASHCGECFNACAPGETCVELADGQRACSCGELVAGAPNRCASPTSVCCNDTCMDDDTLCSCGSDLCDAAFSSPFCCGSGAAESCVDLSDDDDHCGACGNACAPPRSCVGGTCSCPQNKPNLCGDACVDLFNDPDNCTACGQACPDGVPCQDGACRCQHLTVVSTSTSTSGTTLTLELDLSCQLNTLVPLEEAFVVYSFFRGHLSKAVQLSEQHSSECSGQACSTVTLEITGVLPDERFEIIATNALEIDIEGDKLFSADTIALTPYVLRLRAPSPPLGGTLGFTRALVTPSIGQAVDVEIADLNNDGALDIVMAYNLTKTTQASPPPGPIEIYLNAGSGPLGQRFSSPPYDAQLPASYDRIEGLALGDIDLDGDIDITAVQTVTNQSSGLNAILLNEGDATFVHDDVWLGAYRSSDVALTDLDGDGDLDIAIANRSNNRSLYLNQSEESLFFSRRDMGPTSSYYATGDLDSDGNQDVILAHGATGAAAENSDAVACADLDGDGDLDCVFGNRANEPSSLWENTLVP